MFLEYADEKCYINIYFKYILERINEYVVHYEILYENEKRRWNWGGGGAVYYNPLPATTSLQLWLDANDYRTINYSSSNIISNWTDKSGKGQNAVNNNVNNANGSVNVTYTIIGFNKLPSINFSSNPGNPGRLRSSSPSGTYNNGITFFVVFQKHSAVNGGESLFNKASGFPTPFDIYNNVRYVGGLPGTVQNPYVNLTSNNNGINLQNATELNIMSAVVSNTRWDEYINGTDKVLNFIYTSEKFVDTIDYIYIGARGDEYQKYTGYITEIISYNSILSPTDRQFVEGYLAWKWGVTTLPTGHPYYSISPSSNPLNVSNCVIWFNAQDTSSYTLSGSTITSLKDKSNNGNNTSTSYGSSANYVTNAINTYPAFRFTGGGFVGNFATTYTGSGGLTYFAILKIGVYNTYARILSFGDATTTDDSTSSTKTCLTQSDANGVMMFKNGSNVKSSSALTLDTPYLVSGYYDSTVFYLGINGTYIASGTVSASNFNFTKFSIGMDSFSNSKFVSDMYYGEVLVFANTLNVNQRKLMEGYLAWKWGLQTSLPVGHPYKSAAP